jgi:hypothetical protein
VRLSPFVHPPPRRWGETLSNPDSIASLIPLLHRLVEQRDGERRPPLHKSTTPIFRPPVNKTYLTICPRPSFRPMFTGLLFWKDSDHRGMYRIGHLCHNARMSTPCRARMDCQKNGCQRNQTEKLPVPIPLTNIPLTYPVIIRFFLDASATTTLVQFHTSDRLLSPYSTGQTAPVGALTGKTMQRTYNKLLATNSPKTRSNQVKVN